MAGYDHVILLNSQIYYYGKYVHRYSSGAVFVWTLTSEEGPLILESGPAHSSSRPALCCISQGWAAVATDDGM